MKLFQEITRNCELPERYIYNYLVWFEIIYLITIKISFLKQMICTFVKGENGFK
jgi:hypothetical protein